MGLIKDLKNTVVFLVFYWNVMIIRYRKFKKKIYKPSFPICLHSMTPGLVCSNLNASKIYEFLSWWLRWAFWSLFLLLKSVCTIFTAEEKNPEPDHQFERVTNVFHGRCYHHVLPSGRNPRSTWKLCGETAS